MSDPSLNPAPAPPPPTPTPAPAPTPTPAPVATTPPSPVPAPTVDGTSLPPEKSLLNQEEPTAPTGAPDKYDLKPPEGFDLDADVLGEATTLFKGMNLSNDHAQKLVDFYSKNVQQAMDAPVEFWKSEQQKWVNEIKADPELGGRLDEVRTTVSRAVDSVLGPQLGVDFKKAMDYTGAGNNPAFIRGLYKMSQLLSEGVHVQGKNPAPVRNEARPASAAAAMYPDLPSSAR